MPAGDVRFGSDCHPGRKRDSLNFRFAPKATELLRRREMTRTANKRH
jgi:hypothetical protein